MNEWHSDPQELRRILKELDTYSDRTVERTQGYLDAGLSLVTEALTKTYEGNKVHPLFAWLTNEELFQAMRNQRPEEEHWGGAGSFRARWEPHAAFIRDLIRWLRARKQRPPYPQRNPAAIQQAFETNKSASRLIRKISRDNMDSLVATPLFRLQVFSTIITPPGPPEDLEVPQFYQDVEKRWLPIIEKVFKAHNLKLRTGVSQRDLLQILIAVGEGLALREMAEPTSGRRQSNRLNLQAITALALLVACTSDVDESLDESLDRIADARRKASS